MNDVAPRKSGGEFLLYQAEDGQVKLEVRLQNETVWLTQQMMAELFQTTIPNISMHIRNIYEEGELTPEATIKKFLTVRQEGNRDVRRELDYYNLDMIISVGYRVKSYPQSSAMDYGFVKEPAVATRENFDAANYSVEGLEKVKLED